MTSLYSTLISLESSRVGNSIFQFSIFRSFQSLKNINRDRIALVNLWKRSTVIESVFQSQKTSDLIKKKNFFCMFLTVFPLFRPNDWIVPIDLQTLIFLKDHWNRLALVILWKRSTVIESISSIIEKDRRDWMDPVDL